MCSSDLAGSRDAKGVAAGTALVSMRTTSGGSLGSLSKYSMDWNLDETCEASSSLKIPEYPPPMNPTAEDLDTSSPMTIGQRLYELKSAMLRVDDSVEVTFFFSEICLVLSRVMCTPPSPRDSGWVACYLARISLLSLCM